MTETLKDNNSKQKQNDWDILTKMSMTDTNKPQQGASKAFRQEAMLHRQNAEAFYQQASQDQKNKLEDIGIRDAQDAGEHLHEKASWEQQVEREAKSLERVFETQEQVLLDNGMNGFGGGQGFTSYDKFNPITGELIGEGYSRDEYNLRLKKILQKQDLIPSLTPDDFIKRKEKEKPPRQLTEKEKISERSKKLNQDYYRKETEEEELKNSPYPRDQEKYLQKYQAWQEREDDFLKKYRKRLEEDQEFREIAENEKKDFQALQEDSIRVSSPESLFYGLFKATSTIIKNELHIQDYDDNEPEVKPRSRGALQKEAANKLVDILTNDVEKNQRLHDSIYYATVKRIIQREAEEKAMSQKETEEVKSESTSVPRTSILKRLFKNSSFTI